MVYTPHSVVKPTDIVNTAVGIVEFEATIPNLVRREGIDQFKGQAGDKVTYRVPGLLPARRYAFRNDRSEPIKYDTFAESTTTVTFGDRIYQGVRVTDEQFEFDLNQDWSRLVDTQSRAVARGLVFDLLDTIFDAEVNAVIGGAGLDIRQAFAKAKKVLDRFGAPKDGRVALVGSDIAQLILLDPSLSLTNAVSQARAESALANATLGKIYGFTVVEDPNIEPDEARLWTADSIVQYTAAPYVPASVPFSASTSYDGYALRWTRHYDQDYYEDRSVVTTYCGSNVIEDYMIRRTDGPTASDPDREQISTEPHQVRMIGMHLDVAEAKAPEAGGEVATFSGIAVDDVTVTAPAAG